jgi:predicted O-methyltransferase YrrM
MYNFTMDFNCGRGAVTNIANFINTYGVPNSIIEIGVFEGSTTFWMADQLTPHNPNLKIYAVDPHVGSNDMTEDFSLVQQNFEHNLKECQYKNVTYIRKHSQDGLIDLINQGVEAELIYVDGDHKAGEVLTDLVLSWKLLKVGGIILCDDTTTWRYTDSNGTESAQMSVRMAVEMFIQCNWHKVRILQLPDSTQTAFMKIKE